MSRYHAAEFEGPLDVDGHEYVACTFMDAILRFGGGRPPSFQGCIFNGVSFEFVGAAANTVAFLQAMSAPGSGFSALVKETFPDLDGSPAPVASRKPEDRVFGPARDYS